MKSVIVCLECNREIVELKTVGSGKRVRKCCPICNTANYTFRNPFRRDRLLIEIQQEDIRRRKECR